MAAWERHLLAVGIQCQPVFRYLSVLSAGAYICMCGYLSASLCATIYIYAARCYSYHAVFDFSLHRYVYSSCCVYTYHVVQLCKKTPGRYEYVYVSYTQHATCTQTPRGKPIAFIYIVVYVYTFEYPGFCYYNNIVV